MRKNPIRLIPLHLNVIPPYGRPALIPLVTSMDDSDKEFTSIPSVDGTARSQGRAKGEPKGDPNQYNYLTSSYVLPV